MGCRNETASGHGVSQPRLCTPPTFPLVPQPPLALHCPHRMSLDTDIAAFVEKHRHLIDLERQAEVEETTKLQATLSAPELERRGLCLLRLRIADEHAGLGGRDLLELEPTKHDELPPSRIRPGDIVSVRAERTSMEQPAAAATLTGVVYRLTPRRLTLALDSFHHDLPEAPLRLDRVANDVTYQRLRDVLKHLLGYRGGPADRLRKVLFGAEEPRFDKLESALGVDPTLDASQRDAVAFALAARDVALLHGPPGTGKTTTIAEIIRQASRRGERVLAGAGSNVAVDNLVEHLVRTELRVVRTGHPARLLPSVREHSLDTLVEKAAGTKIAADIRRELEQVRRRRGRASKWQTRREMRSEMRELATELRELEKHTIRQVLSDADVVLTTNIGAADALLAGMDFDLVVIDEAAQAIEASAWIPILKGRRAVLAGDHCQLPPTICSSHAQREGLGVTLFERLIQTAGEEITRMLTVQYRMHERIMEWSSGELYDGRLEAHNSVRHHLLAHLPHCAATPESEACVLLIDTAGCDLEEELDEEGHSKANDGEARVVFKHLEHLLEAGVRPEEIAVITPYNAQVARLRRRLHTAYPALEIGSVDGFQGREKEAVVISMVRSNARGDVGFLADERRMNVAVTRARRHVAIIGDSATVSSHPFLGRLMEYCQKKGEYRTAWEYL